MGVNLARNTPIATNIISTGTGGMAITGTGGGTGSGGADYGVSVDTLQSTGGGAITITGTAGGNGGSAFFNYGVLLSQNIIGSGLISITGTGGDSSFTNAAIIQASGTTITNTGGMILTAIANGSAHGDIGLASLAAGTGTITLNAPNGVSSTGSVTAAGLRLLGGAGASVTLTNAGNAVTTIAANTGFLTYSQTGDLTVGTVGGTIGVTASGFVKLVSTGGNLTIANGAKVTSAGINNALILQAGAATLQPNATGGDFINNAGPGALSTPNGHWLVYTGHLVGSGTVDGGLFYTAQNNTDTSYNPGPVFTNFIFFRGGPAFTPVTASLSGTVIKTYDGTLVAPLSAGNFGLSGVSQADQGNVILTVNGTIITQPTYGVYSTKNVGNNLQVTVSGLGLNQPVSTSYQLTATTISANIGFINPAQLTISALSESKSYDGTTISSLIPGYAGLQTGDSLTGLGQAFLSKNVMGSGGSMLAVNNNYLLTDGNNGNNYTVQLNTAAGTIYPAFLTISANFDAKTYDGTVSSAATPVHSQLQSGDSLTGLTQVFASRNAMGDLGSTLLMNSYVLNDGNNGNNYTVTLGTVSGTIRKADLGISPVSDTKVYDGTTYSSLAPIVSGLAAGDSLTGLVQVFTSKNVMGLNNSLLIVDPGYTLNDGNGGNNYNVFDFGSAFGTITPAPLTYLANPISRTYGKGNGSITGVLSGIQVGDTQATVASGKLKFSTAATNASNVGSYAINGSGLAVISGNYMSAIGQDAANATALTITPAQLTYKADKASRTYGAADPVFTGTVTGFVLGQDLNSATTGTLLFTTAADITSNVGKYAIDGSGLTANFGNYYFAQANSNAKALTIDPAILTYIADPTSRAFGTAYPVFTGTVTGFVLGQDLATATTGKKTSPAGSYDIKGAGLTANNGNYKFVQADSNAMALTIVP